MMERVGSIRVILLLATVVLWALTTPAVSQPLKERERLVGAEDPLLSRLEQEGIHFEATYTGEVFSNLSGGLRQGTVYLDKMDLRLSLNLDSLFGIREATLYVNGFSNHGKAISPLVGDAQGISNIEAPNSWRLFELWWQQTFLQGKLSLRAGLYDLNSEFDFTETAQVFLNSSHGIGAEYSQTGLNGPSIYPFSSLAARFLFRPKPTFYTQVAILDGVAGNPNNPLGTQVILNKRDGVLLSSEIGLEPQGPDASHPDFTKYAVGSWLYTSQFNEIQLDVEHTRRNSPRNWGFYGLFERAIHTDDSTPSRNLRFFLRAGWANSHFNQFNSYIGSGLVYTGILPCRSNDRIGLAVAHARNGNPFLRGTQSLSEPMDRFETVLELTYEARVTPWLILHPDLQYVLNPGTHSEISNALVAGVRFEVAF